MTPLDNRTGANKISNKLTKPSRSGLLACPPFAIGRVRSSAQWPKLAIRAAPGHRARQRTFGMRAEGGLRTLERRHKADLIDPLRVSCSTKSCQTRLGAG